MVDCGYTDLATQGLTGYTDLATQGLTVDIRT